MSKLSQAVRGSAVIVAFAAGAVSSALAASPPDSTDVAFISITQHRVLSTTIAAKHSSSPVVIAASTTVPADATTVQLSITAHSTQAGRLAVYPAGHPMDKGDHIVAFPASTTVTATDDEHPGLAGEVSLLNSGPASVTVTVTIIGYSTQVNAGSISGSGGTAGQVLIDVTGTIERATADADVQCRILTGPTGAPVDTARVAVDAAAPDQSLAMHVVATLSAGTYVDLNWFGNQPTWLIQYGMTALQVGTAHNQS